MGKGLEIAAVYCDDDIAIRVRKFLLEHHFPSLQVLQVDVQDGELTVRGEVESFYEKQIAMSICQRVPGVNLLVDKIEVAV